MQAMEVKKDGLSQRQDGTWKLSVTVHPNDMPLELLSAPMGQFYMMAMSPFDPDNPEIEQPPNATEKPEKPEGQRAVIRAALLCKDADFQSWMAGQIGELLPDQGRDELCAGWLRAELEIASRSELASNVTALDAFKRLETSFKYKDQINGR